MGHFFFISGSNKYVFFQLAAQAELDKAKKERNKATTSDPVQVLEKALENLEIKSTHSNVEALETAMTAVRNGDLKALEDVLKDHKDVVNNLSVANGRTILHEAVYFNKIEMVNRICQLPHVDLEKKTSTGNTALHIACSLVKPEVIKILIRKGAQVNALNGQRNYPLLLAVAAGSLECCQLLLSSRKCLTNSVDPQFGGTALHRAAHLGHTEIGEELIRYGFQVASRNGMKRQPLHCAARSGKVDFCRILIRNGADVNSRADRKMTPLHLCCGKSPGNIDTARLLVESGARTDLADRDRKLPADFALIHKKQIYTKLINGFK